MKIKITKMEHEFFEGTFSIQGKYYCNKCNKYVEKKTECEGMVEDEKT